MKIVINIMNADIKMVFEMVKGFVIMKMENMKKNTCQNKRDSTTRVRNKTLSKRLEKNDMTISFVLEALSSFRIGN